MNCQRCGTANKSEYAACFRCGAALAAARPFESSAQKLWYPAGAPRPAAARKKTFSENASAPLIALEDETAQPRPGRITSADKLSSIRDGEDVTLIIPPEPEPLPDPETLIRRRRAVRRTVSIFILIAMLFGIGYGGIRLVQSVVRAYRSWQEERLAASLPPEPLVERALLDGSVWHKITFYGEDGERVLIEDPRESKAIRDGVAEFFLNDEYFVSRSRLEDGDVITVSLKATLFSKTGEETAITVPSYTIDIPDSPLKIILPEQQNYETNENRVPLKIKVTPGSRVLIGDNNVSDLVDAEGYLTTTAEVQPVGVNTIRITVETEGHRPAVYDLKVNRPELAVRFELDSNPPASTKDSSIVFSGVTEPGATITTEAKISGGSTDVNAEGRFEFTVRFTRYGENLIDLSIKSADGRTSRITYRINRTPEISSYTKSAWVMDYPYLSTSTNALIGKIFECKGTVVKKIDDETSNYYLFDVGTAGVTQYIVLEYNADGGLTEGSYYTIFADVTGTYREYPLLAGRFIKLE